MISRRAASKQARQWHDCQLVRAGRDNTVCSQNWKEPDKLRSLIPTSDIKEELAKIDPGMYQTAHRDSLCFASESQKDEI